MRPAASVDAWKTDNGGASSVTPSSSAVCNFLAVMSDDDEASERARRRTGPRGRPSDDAEPPAPVSRTDLTSIVIRMLETGSSVASLRPTAAADHPHPTTGRPRAGTCLDILTRSVYELRRPPPRGTDRHYGAPGGRPLPTLGSFFSRLLLDFFSTPRAVTQSNRPPLMITGGLRTTSDGRPGFKTSRDRRKHS